MQFDIKKQAVPCFEMLLNTTVEQSVECDILLPDYCPDILKVLSCRMESNACDCMINGRTLTVDTMAVIDLCYLGDNGCIKKTQYKMPISKSVELAQDPKIPMTYVCCEQGYLNCRAVSGRRFDVRGTMLIHLNVYHAVSKQVLSPTDQSAICVKPCTINGVAPSMQLSRTFSTREELSIPSGKLKPSEILNLEVVPIVKECSLSANHSVVKGDMAVHALYLGEGDACAVDTLDYLLPFSHMDEIAGISPQSICTVQIKCASSGLSLEGEDLAAGKVLLEVQLVCIVRIFENISISTVCDAFSQDSPAQIEKTSLDIASQIIPLDEGTTVKAKCDLPPTLTAISDCSVTLTCPLVKRDDHPLVTFKATFMTLYTDSVSGYASVECFAQMSVPIILDDDYDNLFVLPVLVPSAPSAVIVGKELQVQGEVWIGGIAIPIENTSAISDVIIGEPYKEKKKNQSLIIYYPFEGEDVWDIGKRYTISPELIMHENDLESMEITSRDPIIIPNI